MVGLMATSFMCVVVVWNLDLEAFWMIANDTKV